MRMFSVGLLIGWLAIISTACQNQYWNIEDPRYNCQDDIESLNILFKVWKGFYCE